MQAGICSVHPEKREPVPEHSERCATIDSLEQPRMVFGPVLHDEQAGFPKMSEEREASVQILKAFAPLDGLKRDNLAALAKKVSVRTMPAGRVLFKEGDTDKRTVWV